MTAHSILAPSSGHRWCDPDGCRGSVALQQRYPDREDTESAREGTAGHFYGTEALQGRLHPVGTLAPNGYVIDQEMVDCAQTWIRDVRDTHGANPAARLFVEHRVAITAVHPDCFGTPDCFLIDFERKYIWIWDYKYGHRWVEAFRNWQLLLYLVGIFEHFGILAAEPGLHGWRMTLTITQPRQYSPRPQEWSLSGAALADLLPGMKRAAWEATQPDATYRTGSHCLNCSGAAHCPALLVAAGAAIDVSLWAQPIDPTPHTVSLRLRHLKLAADRIKAQQVGLEELALHMTRQGLSLPLHRTDFSKGREQWTVDVDTVVTTGEMFGADLRKPPAALTPNQARKTNVPDSVIKAMSTIPTGALKLVEYDPDDAVRAFGDN